MYLSEYKHSVVLDLIKIVEVHFWYLVFSVLQIYQKQGEDTFLFW